MYNAESIGELKEASRRLAFWFRSYPPECIGRTNGKAFRTMLAGTLMDLSSLGYCSPRLENLVTGINKALDLVEGQSFTGGGGGGGMESVVEKTRCVQYAAPLTGYSYAY